MTNKPVVVMGMGPSGLFIARQLSHITNNIYGLGRKDDVGMYSKYIPKSKRCYATTEADVYGALKNILEKEGVKPTVLLCSDQYLTMLVNAKYDWNEVSTLAGTNLSVLKNINNKEKINQYCNDTGIKIPQTMDMREFIAKEDKQFPIIIKWKEKELEAKDNPIGKVLVCNTSDDFLSLLDQLKDSWVTLEILLVQTYISGNNNFQYSVGAYYHEGEPLATVTVKQIKQYPQGISAQVYTIDDEIAEEVKAIAERLAKSFNFSGFLETEFKIDSVTGLPYLLDINPRPWGWVSLLGSAYQDFYKVLLGEKPKGEKKNVVWISPIRRMLSVKNKNNVALPKMAKNYAKAFDIKDSMDRKPSLMIYAMAIKKKIKRK